MLQVGFGGLSVRHRPFLFRMNACAADGIACYRGLTVGRLLLRRILPTLFSYIQQLSPSARHSAPNAFIAMPSEASLCAIDQIVDGAKTRFLSATQVGRIGNRSRSGQMVSLT